MSVGVKISFVNILNVNKVKFVTLSTTTNEIQILQVENTFTTFNLFDNCYLTLLARNFKIGYVMLRNKEIKIKEIGPLLQE